MKKVLTYFAAGCLFAIIGLFFTANLRNLFNGIDDAGACVLGMGMYLCVVIVTCTGIIVSKITDKQNKDIFDKNDN